MSRRAPDDILDDPIDGAPDSAIDAEIQARFEERMARALLSPDPAGAMQALAGDTELPHALRQAAARAITSGPGTRGIELTALLIANLRFQRLLQGSREAATWFARDPQGFSEAFRDYHHQVAPAAYFPAQEAERFAAWLAAR